MSRLSLRARVTLAAATLLLAGAAAFFFFRSGEQQPIAKPDERATQKEPKGVRFKRPDDAKLRGIEAQNIQAVAWKPKLHIDGRVVNNPHATLDVRAPFAGIVCVGSAESANPGCNQFALGSAMKAGETLALFEGRFTLTESLDLKTKLVEAQARHKNAEEVIKIRQKRLERLSRLPTGLLSQDEADNAAVQLSEARMQANVALTQWNIWKEALEAVGKKTVIVPLQSAIAGVITEVAVQPGAHVDAGQLIARIVDFRRVLVRLDFPVAIGNEKQPGSVQVNALDSAVEWRASLRGRVSNLEPGLQKASWFYELMPDEREQSPRWPAGLFVQAILDDPAKSAQPAIAIPSSALLVHQGRALVYLEKRLGRYERREVNILGQDDNTLYVAPEGWLVAEDRVVTGGAQVLLSEEFRNDMDDD